MIEIFEKRPLLLSIETTLFFVLQVFTFFMLSNVGVLHLLIRSKKDNLLSGPSRLSINSFISLIPWHLACRIHTAMSADTTMLVDMEANIISLKGWMKTFVHHHHHQTVVEKRFLGHLKQLECLLHLLKCGMEKDFYVHISAFRM